MKKYLLLAIGIVLGAAIVFVLTFRDRRYELISPLVPTSLRPKPLEKLSFENLRKREYPVGEIKLEKVIKEETTYTSWLFSYQTDGKRVTGMANLPLRQRLGQAKFPVVVMLRGYADEEIYFTGLGTRKAAGFFAENGFLTLAPDFLGFGESDWASEDILEARFYRPVEVLNLLASIKTLPQANPEKVAIWAHSNGGQIALSVLEISQKPISTVLWTPVTRGFPESVLDYMGDPPAGEAGLDDQGKKVKAAIEEFLRLYDPKIFSIDNYFADIQAPFQVHQGTADEYIKSEWTDEFVATMKSLGKQVTYFKYPANDHNLKQSWDLVVARDLKFFQDFL
jgi:dipeptidyl aminopeptidase/acylaminoacyl peptidase